MLVKGTLAFWAAGPVKAFASRSADFPPPTGGAKSEFAAARTPCHPQHRRREARLAVSRTYGFSSGHGVPVIFVRDERENTPSEGTPRWGVQSAPANAGRARTRRLQE